MALERQGHDGGILAKNGASAQPSSSARWETNGGRGVAREVREELRVVKREDREGFSGFYSQRKRKLEGSFRG